ncbi:MAG: hypothetical protein RLZZ546_796 [Bacteroidota bacterium]|jgi:thiol-disulfide isomerase/thioredoxin
MKLIFRLSISFLLLFSSILVSANSLPNIEKGGFEKAKMKAKLEGKMLFLDFYASWCSPCKWMDETTFKDQRVLDILKEKYVAIKVNIDDFEGFELKSKFDIRFLPTILIFSPDGKMTDRYEETMGIQKLLGILDQSYLNKDIYVHNVNTSPRQAPTLETPQLDPRESYDNNKKQYRLQVGVFTNADKAFKKSEELKQTFIEPVTIIQDDKNGKTIYKVLLGDNRSYTEAKSFKKILKEQFQLEAILY